MTMQMDNTDPTRPTIGDVAKLAAVSIKTVSRVVNKHPNVRDSTRLRVQQVIEKLSYEPNPYAQYLGSLRARKVTAQRVML